MHFHLLLLREALVVFALLLLTACATRHTEAPRLLASDGSLAKTYYQGELRTDDNVQIRFTVFQPALKPGENAPLLLQIHPFGLWRMSSPDAPLSHVLTSGDVVREAWKKGYWIISYDQRGHGDSGDVMHIADPQKEARDVSRIIDWAEKNLAIARVDGDPQVGIIGESYGAGVQLVASALDARIDALVPIAGWYDLERVLAPNDVPKSGWMTILVLAGNTIADYDKRLNKAYWHARGGSIDAWVREEFSDNDVGWFCEHGKPPHADALVIQGFRDVLFPVNEGLSIHACLKDAGRDARFVGVDGGHLLPGTQHTPGWLVGWHIEETLDCDGSKQKTSDVIFNWFEAKLRGKTELLATVPAFCLTGDVRVDAVGAVPASQPFELARAHVGSGASGLFEWVARPLDHVKNWFVPANGDNWQQARSGWLRPALIPATRVDGPQWVVGVPHVSLDIDEADRAAPVLFLQVAAWRPGSGTYRALSEQVTPVRGTGHIETDLAAVRGKVADGEVLGLLVRGYQAQYRFSGSGFGTDASVRGRIALPISPATGASPAPAAAAASVAGVP